jgi:hypothetical protein
MARGQTDRAASHYRAFLERYDLAPPAQAHLREEARSALTIIGQQQGAEPH